jgi:phage host-nuclease inhibitor protein Gam
MQAKDEIMQLVGERIRTQAEIKSKMESQIKPLRHILVELDRRITQCYCEQHQLKLPLDHASDITEE